MPGNETPNIYRASLRMIILRFNFNQCSVKFPYVITSMVYFSVNVTCISIIVSFMELTDPNEPQTSK